MFFTIVMMLMRASIAEVPAETPDDAPVWNCRNQLEVWCSADGCAASEPDAFTPMDITARRSGALSVCAYTGCWEGEADITAIDGRLIWTSDKLQFSTSPDAFQSSVTLLINQKDGVGFVRVGGLATPVLCQRSVSASENAE